MSQSDGSTADYYTLPEGATELQALISANDMNAQIGEIFRACYRYGRCPHSPKLRDIRKILFYAQAEEKRLLAEMDQTKAARRQATIDGLMIRQWRREKQSRHEEADTWSDA